MFKFLSNFVKKLLTPSDPTLSNRREKALASENYAENIKAGMPERGPFPKSWRRMIYTPADDQLTSLTIYDFEGLPMSHSIQCHRSLAEYYTRTLQQMINCSRGGKMHGDSLYSICDLYPETLRFISDDIVAYQFIEAHLKRQVESYYDYLYFHEIDKLTKAPEKMVASTYPSDRLDVVDEYISSNDKFDGFLLSINSEEKIYITFRDYVRKTDFLIAVARKCFEVYSKKHSLMTYEFVRDTMYSFKHLLLNKSDSAVTTLGYGTLHTALDKAFDKYFSKLHRRALSPNGSLINFDDKDNLTPPQRIWENISNHLNEHLITPIHTSEVEEAGYPRSTVPVSRLLSMEEWQNDCDRLLKNIGDNFLLEVNGGGWSMLALENYMKKHTPGYAYRGSGDTAFGETLQYIYDHIKEVTKPLETAPAEVLVYEERTEKRWNNTGELVAIRQELDKVAVEYVSKGGKPFKSDAEIDKFVKSVEWPDFVDITNEGVVKKLLQLIEDQFMIEEVMKSEPHSLIEDEKKDQTVLMKSVMDSTELSDRTKKEFLKEMNRQNMVSDIKEELIGSEVPMVKSEDKTYFGYTLGNIFFIKSKKNCNIRSARLTHIIKGNGIGGDVTNITLPPSDQKVPAVGDFAWVGNEEVIYVTKIAPHEPARGRYLKLYVIHMANGSFQLFDTPHVSAIGTCVSVVKVKPYTGTVGNQASVYMAPPIRNSIWWYNGTRWSVREVTEYHYPSRPSKNKNKKTRRSK